MTIIRSMRANIYTYPHIYIYILILCNEVALYVYIYVSSYRPGTVLLVGRSWNRIPVASFTGIFLVDTDITMCPGVNSASKNEYQGFPWG